MAKINFHHIPSQPLPIKRQTPGQQLHSNKTTFAEHLQSKYDANQKLTISKHAEKRLQERNININEQQWNAMEEKMFEAKKLGVIDSLVLVDDAALIVSAKNNTVITAMNRAEASSQIFTNINGTIILN